MARVKPRTADTRVDRKVKSIVITAVTDTITIAILLLRVGDIGTVILYRIVAMDNEFVAMQAVRVLNLQEVITFRCGLSSKLIN